MNVYLSGNIADMRGPCASGFHVPSETELGGLVSLMSGLGLSANDYSTKLHIPVSGFISESGTKSTAALWGLWTCTKSSTNYAGIAYNYWNSEVKKYLYAQTTLGYNIRPFHNGYVAPTSSWTVIQGTLGSAGIFRDTVNGLISITGDGSTGYTIADKNLGATTVYSDGDTLSEANCGKFYQWGNNYGFPFTGPITTSTTAINASSYGPGNYYNSSTFIKINGTWDSSYNANLRGGVTGGINELQNAYIGEYVPGWEPGANTLAYYPLNSTTTVNDTSGNSYNLTNNGSVTFGNVGGVNCATFSGSNYLSRTSSLFTGNPTFTYNVWLRQTSTSSSTENIVAIGSGYSTNSFIMWIKSSGNILYTGGWTNDRDTGYTPPLNTWINLGVTYASNVIRVYINGTQIFSDTLTSFTITSTSTNIGTGVGGSSSPMFIGNMSNTIFENKQWTATEISDYYNGTKSNYGL